MHQPTFWCPMIIALFTGCLTFENIQRLDDMINLVVLPTIRHRHFRAHAIRLKDFDNPLREVLWIDRLSSPERSADNRQSNQGVRINFVGLGQLPWHLCPRWGLRRADEALLVAPDVIKGEAATHGLFVAIPGKLCRQRRHGRDLGIGD